MSKEKQTTIAKELEKLISISRKGTGSQSLTTKHAAGVGEEAGNAAQGYNLTRAEILKDILKANFLEGTLYEQCKKIDISPKANGLFLVRAKETSRTELGGILGGFKAYYLSEGYSAPASKGAFDQRELDINQIGIFCIATNALIQDSLVLEQYLSSGLQETMRYQLDYEVLYGDGAQGMNGILNTGDQVTKYVTLANPFTVQNIKDMMKYYYGGKNGCWAMSHDAWYEIENLYQNTFPLRFYKDGTITLFGYPVIVKDNMHSRSIVLGDFSTYCVAQKPLREDISEHLYFNTNETAFRTIMRVNGAPIWYSPIKGEDGLAIWPFVATMDEDTKSSSSSSSIDSQSSDTSSSTSSQSLSSVSSQSLSSVSSQSLSSQSLSSESSSTSSSSSSSYRP